MIYSEDVYTATNQCNCKNPIFVKFKQPREIMGQLVFGCRVPCGKCELCMKRRQRDWYVRLRAEWRASSSAFFVTLTYDDAHLPVLCSNSNEVSRAGDVIGEYNNLPVTNLHMLAISNMNKDNEFVAVVSKKDCQDFMKRLRKPLGNHRISYFLVSEYGDQFKRPHYHMLLFNYPLIDLESVKKSIEEAWQNGLVSVGTVSGASINYTTKYCLKNENQKENSPVPTFMLCSRRPAIGASWLSRKVTKFFKDSAQGTTCIDGTKFPLPSYYKRKIWDDDELADMYIESIESMCLDLSRLSERIGSLSEVRKLQKEQIEAKCEEINRKQQLAQMRKNANERKFKLNQKPNSKKL